MHPPSLAQSISADIAQAQTLDALTRASQNIATLHIQCVEQALSPALLGQYVSQLTDQITRRLIQFAELRYGAPPVPYAWVVAGSQARHEQTSHSDQDTGLIIDNALGCKDEQWFSQLAQFVSDGLNACGYIYCPGNVMASNPQWRQPQHIWREYFLQWIHKPRKKALMYSSIFFDLRVIHGQADLWEGLHREALSLTQGNSLFIAHMAAIALHHQPPLGFLNRIKVASGEHAGCVDIKKGGIIPIVDLARLFALEQGCLAITTRERLQQLRGSAVLSNTGADSLLTAFDFLSQLRAKVQVQQLSHHQSPDNYVNLSQLSHTDHAQLKTAFKDIRLIQNTLASRLGDGLLDE